jgi:DNA-binding GntR family transcriptional regulator
MAYCILHMSCDMRYAVGMKAGVIRKSSLRQQVYTSLLRLLLQGRWEPGARWNDSALAKELEVSRTPVREAMIQLEAEGLVACDPNRGFYIPALAREEAQEIYPILWSLEQLAVFQLPVSPAELRKRLEQTWSRPASSGTSSDMAAAIRQDRAWHLALVESCANAHLGALHGRLDALTRRYAASLSADAAFADRCARDHAQILDALTSEQPARAHALLKMHWRAEMEAVVSSLGGEKSAPSPAARNTRSAAAGRRL